jgi:predicted MFS family arabinose efflux permease
MKSPYQIIINFLVIVFFVLAFLSAELKKKLILLGIMILLFGLPYIISFNSLSWTLYAARIVFGLACYIFIRRQGFL